jgi:hypothetical protein
MASSYILANPAFKVPYFTFLRLHKIYIKTGRFRLSSITQASLWKMATKFLQFIFFNSERNLCVWHCNSSLCCVVWSFEIIDRALLKFNASLNMSTYEFSF